MKKHPSPPIPKPRQSVQPANGLSHLLARRFWICVLLAIATAIVYWPAVGFDYVNYDDTVFIAMNPHVVGGLTGENIRWAFGTGMDGNWIPLTWLSYMLDADWSGPTATGFHLTNILLHVANTVMVFLLFRRLTGAHWQSALLAGLFGLHPLHVESVAWVAERKDVLSTLFFLFTLWAYMHYVQQAAGKTSTTRDKLHLAGPEKDRRAPRLSYVACYLSPFYWLALIFFFLGLMCKPMLVTLPFVLLLLDYWPLHRIKPENGFIHGATLTRLFCEKIPFFMLAAIASALAILVQHQGRAMESFASRSINLRISNALVAYADYLGKTFWPVDLANPYLLNTHFPLAHVLAAGTVLVGLSALAMLAARKRPYVLAGWLWFLGTLIPVIGLVQVGIQSMADRYTYIPLLGIFWVVIWAAADLIRRWRLPGAVVALASLFILGACAARTRVQLDYWRNGETLFRHTIAITGNNFVAFEGLGWTLYRKGELDEAMFFYLKALEIRPGNGTALTNLNDALIQIEAIDADTNRPHAGQRTGADYANAHNILGMGLAMNGKLDDAVFQFQKALGYDPDNVNARSNLGYAFVLEGRLTDAIAQCERALRLSPHHPRANNILGFALLKQGQWEKAVAPLREALQNNPENAEVHFNLGEALAELGQRDEAVAHFKEALRLAPDRPDIREHLNKLETSPR